MMLPNSLQLGNGPLMIHIKKTRQSRHRTRLQAAASAVVVSMSLTTATFAASLQKTHSVASKHHARFVSRKHHARFVIPTGTADSETKEWIGHYAPPRGPGYNQDTSS